MVGVTSTTFPNTPDRFGEVMSSKGSDPLVMPFECCSQIFVSAYVRRHRRRRDPRGHRLDLVMSC